MNTAILTALLTSGRGPLARACLRTLSEWTDLRVVVKPEPTAPASLRAILERYGGWYVAQRLLYRCDQVSNRRSVAKVLQRFPEVTWSTHDGGEYAAGFLQHRGIELVVSCSFRHVLPAAFLSAFPTCVNLHPSLLPEYRGPDPISWGLIEKQRQFGITLHRLAPTLDTGEILIQRSVDRITLPFAMCIERRLASLIPGMLKAFLTQLQNGSLCSQEQLSGSYRPLPTLANRRRYSEKK